QQAGPPAGPSPAREPTKQNGIRLSPDPVASKKSMCPEEESHQVERTGALDLASDAPVQLGGNASDAPGIDLAGFRGEIAEELRIEVAHLLRRDVKAAARHAPVGATEVDGSLFGFRAHGVGKTGISASRGAGCGA